MAQLVKYVGTSGQRIIFDHEWRGAGVKDQPTLVWNAANGWSVPADKINAEAMTFIEADEGFVLVDSDSKSKKGDRPTEVQVPIQGYPGGTDVPVVQEASVPVDSDSKSKLK